MNNSSAIRVGAAGAALLAAGLMSGCYTAHAIVPGGGIGVSVATAYGCNLLPHGPRVTFVNDSTLTFSVRYWSGRRDTTAPHGVASLRTDDDMVFESWPGDFFITQVGRSWWPTSMSDAVVYACMTAHDPDGAERGPIWFELQQPQPFTFSATGDSLDSIEFKRFGGGGIVPLPRDQWIDGTNGPLPVYNDLAAR